MVGAETRGAALVVDPDGAAFGVAPTDEPGPTRLVGRDVDIRVAVDVVSTGVVLVAGARPLASSRGVGTARALVLAARTAESLPEEPGETLVHTRRWVARSIASLPLRDGFTFSLCRTFYTIGSQRTYVSH